MKKLTKNEELLVELVHFMSYGTDMDLKTTKSLLQKPISNKNGRNCLECIHQEGRTFINEIITYINETEGLS